MRLTTKLKLSTPKTLSGSVLADCRRLTVGACLLTAIVPMGGATYMVAQQGGKDQQTKTIEDWTKIQKEAEAEKAAFDAQKQAIDARKALEQAQAPADPNKKLMDDKTAAANAAKALADAQKAAADASKAQSDAELAALKAKIGDVPSSGYSGAVDAKDKAGNAEAMLLATKALNSAATQIANQLPTQTADTKVLLFASGDVPNFQALLSFRAQFALVESGFSQAQAVSDEATTKAPSPEDLRPEAVPAIAAAGLGLDALNKILGFFRTDYTIQGVEVSLEDAMLVNALAGQVPSDKKLKMQVPSLYNASALSDPSSGILGELTKLLSLRADAQQRISEHDRIAQRFTDDAGKEMDTNKKNALIEKAKLHKQASDVWKSAAAIYDGYFAKLTSPDDKGSVPLANVIRESAVFSVLKDTGLLLAVKLHKSGGAYYTKKNMWTLFGGMPFYNMGGVVASFILVQGNDGTVLKSGVVPVDGGFVKVSDLPKTINETGPTVPVVKSNEQH